MALKAEVSLPIALATGTVVWSIFQGALPSVADMRAAGKNDDTIEGSRRLAAWTAAGVVAGVSLLAKDPTVFVVGGSMVIAMDWWTRHANQVDPRTGKASTGPTGMTNGDVTVNYAPGVGA